MSLRSPLAWSRKCSRCEGMFYAGAREQDYARNVASGPLIWYQ